MDRTVNDDAATVRNVLSGDTEAFRRLLGRHAGSAFRTAYRLTGNEDDAEDVTQETFLRVFQNISRFNGGSSLGTWIHRIAVNCSLDLLRKRRKQLADGPIPLGPQEVATVEPGPDRQAASRKVGLDLQAALKCLTPLERDAFVLRHWEGLPTASIAEVLGLSKEASKQAVFRAVRKLRQELRDAGTPP